MDTAAAKDWNPSAAGERGLMHESPRAINPPRACPDQFLIGINRLGLLD
jgi:hypothetical protein